MTNPEVSFDDVDLTTDLSSEEQETFKAMKINQLLDI
jgi:hypothetical protein